MENYVDWQMSVRFQVSEDLKIRKNFKTQFKPGIVWKSIKTQKMESFWICLQFRSFLKVNMTDSETIQMMKFLGNIHIQIFKSFESIQQRNQLISSHVQKIFNFGWKKPLKPILCVCGVPLALSTLKVLPYRA